MWQEPGQPAWGRERRDAQNRLRGNPQQLPHTPTCPCVQALDWVCRWVPHCQAWGLVTFRQGGRSKATTSQEAWAGDELGKGPLLWPQEYPEACVRPCHSQGAAPDCRPRCTHTGMCTCAYTRAGSQVLEAGLLLDRQGEGQAPGHPALLPPSFL